MGVSRALAAAAGCMFAAGFSFAEMPKAWAQSANPNAQAPNDFAAAPQPDDSQAANSAETVRPFSLSAALALSEYYDSNSQGLTTGKADAVTQAEFDGSVHDRTERFEGDLAYSLIGSFHSASSDLNSVQNYLNAIGRAELWTDHLFLNARAFAWPTFLSRLGSLNAGTSIASTANAANAYGYSASPDLTFRFDGFATSDLIFTQSGEFFSSLADRSQGTSIFANLPDSSHSSQLAARLKSGDDFTQLEWTLNAVGTNSTQRGLQQLQRRADAVLEYHFDHSFALLADGGYRLYHVRPSLSHGLSGPIAIGGFDWTPDPSLHVIAKAGEQYRFTSYMGSVNWQVTAATTLTASLDDVITTPQDSLNINLQSLGVTSGGVFLIPPAATLPGQPPGAGIQTPQTQPIFIGPYGNLALDNDISRYRTATLGAAYKMPRTLFNLIVYGTVRDYLVPVVAASDRQTVYGVDLTGSYNLTRNLSLIGAGDYSVAQEFGGHDKIGTISAGFNYNISPSWSATGRVNFLEREAIGTSTAANGNLTDVQAGLGLRYTF